MIWRAAVFELKGNRFIVPGYWYPDPEPEDYDGWSPAAVIIEAMMFRVMCHCEPKAAWIEAETDENGGATFDGAQVRLHGRGFAHGAIDVLVISGPALEAARAKAKEAGT